MEESIYKDGKYLERNPTWHSEDSKWKSQQILKMISRNSLTPKTICEVGCGAGEILNQLYLELDENVLFDGYEISPQAYNICKGKERDRLRFMLSDITNEKDVFYDLLLCIDVFEHIFDYPQFLKSIRNVADYKIFHIPLDINVYMVVRNLFLKYREEVGHIHYFTKDTALAALNDAGYTITDYFYTSGAIENPNKTGMQEIINLVRQIFSKVDKEFAVRLFGGWSLLVLAK